MQMQVSVVVPAYNREQFIQRCVHSIMAQTVTPFEIIVVDDGSTDKTVEVLERIECTYLRIIRQNHKGAQAARNLGILNAKGEYIAFLDSDDEWLPQMLERNIAYFLKEKSDCALYTDCYKCKNNKKALWSLPGETGDLFDFLLLAQGPTFSGLLARRDIFLKIGLLDEEVTAYQEWDTAIRLAKEVKFVHVKEPLFFYYMHSEKTISKDRYRVINGYAYIIKKHRNSILEKHGYEGLKIHYKFLMQECKKYKSKLFRLFEFKYFLSDFLSRLNKIKGK